jgi:hypothetical protein
VGGEEGGGEGQQFLPLLTSLATVPECFLCPEPCDRGGVGGGEDGGRGGNNCLCKIK